VSEGTLMKVSVIEGRRFLLTPQFAVDREVVTAASKGSKRAFRALAQVVSEIRDEAHQKGVDKMSGKDINQAVATARRDRKKASKRSGR
jgi:hypothetical protein